MPLRHYRPVVSQLDMRDSVARRMCERLPGRPFLDIRFWIVTLYGRCFSRLFFVFFVFTGRDCHRLPQLHVGFVVPKGVVKNVQIFTYMVTLAFRVYRPE